MRRGWGARRVEIRLDLRVRRPRFQEAANEGLRVGVVLLRLGKGPRQGLGRVQVGQTEDGAQMG